MEPVCRIRIPPITDKATAARTEAKALMRGLLEEAGVPALIAKVDAQEAELRRMWEANIYLAARLQATVGTFSFTVHDMADILLEYLSLVGVDGQENGEEVGAYAWLACDDRLTEEQSRSVLARLMASPTLSGRSRLRRDPDVEPPEGETDEGPIGDLEM